MRGGRRSGLTATHSAPARWGGGHDRAIRGTGLLSQSGERGGGRLRLFFELARSLATPEAKLTGLSRKGGPASRPAP